MRRLTRFWIFAGILYLTSLELKNWVQFVVFVVAGASFFVGYFIDTFNED